MARTLSANEVDFLRSNAQRKTDRQIGEVLGLEAREIMRERLRLGLRKSWANAWNAGKSKIEKRQELREDWKRRSDCGRSRHKVVILLSDMQSTEDPMILEITLADDGRKLRVRRDLVEPFPGGRLAIPEWLWEKINR